MRRLIVSSADNDRVNETNYELPVSVVGIPQQCGARNRQKVQTDNKKLIHLAVLRRLSLSRCFVMICSSIEFERRITQVVKDGASTRNLPKRGSELERAIETGGCLTNWKAAVTRTRYLEVMLGCFCERRTKTGLSQRNCLVGKSLFSLPIRVPHQEQYSDYAVPHLEVGAPRSGAYPLWNQ